MLRKFIENPVLSTVISIIIVILGLLGLFSLPISQYPEIAPPTVEVSAAYQGASAEVVMKSVITPLEEQINGVEDMTYMTSKSSNNGSAVITIFFKQGTNPDLAAVNVQNRVSKATSQLPADVIKAGITTSKKLSSTAFSFLFYDESGKYDQKFLDNYLRINIMPQMKRVEGVGGAEIYGMREYSMRIWLKPDAMANHGLVPDDIVDALKEQNIEAAPGKIGENSKQAVQYTLKYTGRLDQVNEFEQIILRSDRKGNLLRLKDVADIEFGALEYTTSLVTNGKVSSGGEISQTSGSNARELIISCENILKDASKDFPPGIKYSTFLNANDFLDASIEKVVHTIIEAFILVFIVVFIFLQDFRSTLIPAIAVPVSIIGTFFFLKLFGFTINLLTLFALVLAIGIVVDDAIVVVEAVHAKLDQGAKSAKKATMHAMSEISSAIISITLIMSAVFLPVTFITGSAGVFYKQFGLTLAVAIVISAVNALTLSPALCAILLKPHQPGRDHQPKEGFLPRFFTGFNTAFEVVTFKYIHAVKFLVRRKWISAVGILAFSLIFYSLMKTTPTGFVPNEDGGSIYGNIVLPPAATLERTVEISKEVDSIVRSIPEVELSSSLSGMDLFNGFGGSYGALFIRLKPWDERMGKGQDINSVVGQLFAKTAHVKGAKLIFFAAPTLQGFGNSNGFEMQLQDRTGGDYRAFSQSIDKFMAAINQRPEIMYATSPFNIGFPEYQVNVNVAKCKDAGVSVNMVLNTLQGYFGGIYASDFNKFGKQYRVMIQSQPDLIGDEQTLNKIFVRSANGMMPVSELVTLSKTYGPEFINRFNLFNSTTVTGSPNEGYSSGDAIRALEEVAAETLDRGYTYEFSGLTREELSSGSQTVLIFALCLLFIYFLLSAQYKSYILPFSVLLSLPVGLAGAFIFANLFGVDNNIFLQISLIMLIGLLAKNAILIVEFSLMHRLSGRSLVQAAILGARARLRPILMTSFAFIFGLLPLMLSTGAGALSNKSIGTAAIGGMLIGTLFGVFVIPVLFIVFQSVQEKLFGIDQPAHEPRAIQEPLL